MHWRAVIQANAYWTVNLYFPSYSPRPACSRASRKEKQGTGEREVATGSMRISGAVEPLMKDALYLRGLELFTYFMYRV